MKMILISITKSWLCATGVAVIASYCILTHSNGTTAGQKRAAQVAARISERGTAPKYKSTNRHSSATKKKTTAKVGQEIKVPKYVPNPIYIPFTNAVNKLMEDVAEIAKDREVKFEDGFILVNKDGKPTLKFPEAYTNVTVGGVAIGDEFKGARFSSSRKINKNTGVYEIDEVALSGRKHLGEPEFYCTEVTYSVLPATKQVDAIWMHGDLYVERESKANRMVREIKQWMKEDYGAVDLHADVPEGTLAFKKFRIGKGMDVEVAVNWKPRLTDDGCDAHIDISFTVSELVEEDLSERQELGDAADEARIDEYSKTGVNYFTVRPMVKEDDVKRKVVR